MHKYITIALILSVLILAGCSSRDSLYDLEKVKKRLAAVTKDEEIEAHDWMSKGHHQLNFEHAPDMSVPLYEKAVQLHPAPYIYFQLGEALMENGEFDKSFKAFDISDTLGYEEKHELYYNMACAASLNRDFRLSETYLEKALEAGFSDFKQITEGERLSLMRGFINVGKLINKYNKSLSLPELAMTGAWHAAPHVSAGFNEVLQFFHDRRFVFHKSEYDALNRETSVKGTYEIKDGVLILTLNKVVMLEGGEIVDSVITGDKEIEGGELVEKELDPPHIIKKSIASVTKDDAFNGKWKVIIDNKPFWRLSHRPEEY